MRVSSSAPPRKTTPEAEMAIAIRDAGHFRVQSHHPTLCSWVTDGFTIERVLECFELAQRQKPGEVVSPNYVDKILRAPVRAPPKSAADRITWRPPPDDEPDVRN